MQTSCFNISECMHLYEQCCWWSLYLVLWPQMNMKILAKFKFGIGASQHITPSCVHVFPDTPLAVLKGGLGTRPVHVYQGALPSPRLSLHVYKKCNWHHAGAELAICTARMVLGGAKNTWITSFHVVGNNIIGRF